ncbi:MAG: glycosyltransferase family 2 protein [Deltaproteobacteria bacterium]|nr:glycosyltransferase family 2 protein [Deltaproteobacteria bacterium]
MKLDEISVIVPALNEAGNLSQTAEAIFNAVHGLPVCLEILLINDGSRDETGSLANQLAGRYSEIRVIHHSEPKGLGFCYREGIRRATYPRVVMIPGDNEIEETSIRRMFEASVMCDSVLLFIGNTSVRSPVRRLISSFYVQLLNFLFGLKIRYYNGPCILSKERVREVMLSTDGFGYMSAIVVQLAKMGVSLHEVEMRLKPRTYGQTKFFTFRNIWSVLTMLVRLYYKIYLSPQRRRWYTNVS